MSEPRRCYSAVAPPTAPPSSGRIKGRGGRTLDPQALLLMFPPKRGGGWQGRKMLGTASAFLSSPRTEAWSRIREVAVAAIANNINSALFGARSIQVPSTMEGASHALPSLNHKTVLQGDVLP